MLKEKTMAKITGMARLTEDVVSMWLKAKNVAMQSKPGQFVNVYCRDGGRLLPRPISLCEIHEEDGLVRLVFRIVGKGTREFSSYHVGEEVSLMGPLGNGFPLSGKKALLIGGGIGIPPMLELAKRMNQETQIVLGYRDKTFLVEEFNGYGTVHIATEDGSQGTKGTVLDLIREENLTADVVYACGPLPMLRGVKEYAETEGVPAWLSLEERMACGIGACLACVCESVEIDPHSRVKNKRICKDGPVFSATDVVF